MKFQKLVCPKQLLLFSPLLLLIGCATDKKDWLEAERQGTITSYERFLQVHPNAEQAHRAKTRVAELRQANEAWQKAESLDTIEGYGEFLEKFPRAKQGDEALAAIYQLGKMENDWERVKNKNTIEAYDKFIHDYSKRKQVLEARKERARLEGDLNWKSNHHTWSVEAIQSFLQQYPTSRYAMEAQGRLKQLQQDAAWQEAETTNTEASWQAFLARYPIGPKCHDALDRLRKLHNPKTNIPSASKSDQRAVTLRGPLNIEMALTFGRGSYYNYNSGQWVDPAEQHLVMNSECEKIFVLVTANTKSATNPMSIEFGASYRVIGHLKGNVLEASEITKE